MGHPLDRLGSLEDSYPHATSVAKSGAVSPMLWSMLASPESGGMEKQKINATEVFLF